MKSYLISMLTISHCALMGSPYAPTQVKVDSNSNALLYQLGYDEASNRLTKSNRGTGVTQTVQFGLTAKPVAMQRGGDSEKVHYGVGGRRYLRVDAQGLTTLYLDGGMFEYRIPRATESAKSPQAIVYLRNSGYSPIAQADLSNPTPTYTYYVRDHLGSPLLKVKGSNAPAQKRYDPWGQTTNASGTEEIMDDQHRGFTGHENIQSQRLIHMNARVFDPEVPLFLSPDKYIQGRSTVSVNCFTYVHNNPVNAIDPSGWTKSTVHPPKWGTFAHEQIRRSRLVTNGSAPSTGRPPRWEQHRSNGNYISSSSSSSSSSFSSSSPSSSTIPSSALSFPSTDSSFWDYSSSSEESLSWISSSESSSSGSVVHNSLEVHPHSSGNSNNFGGAFHNAERPLTRVPDQIIIPKPPLDLEVPSNPEQASHAMKQFVITNMQEVHQDITKNRHSQLELPYGNNNPDQGISTAPYSRHLLPATLIAIPVAVIYFSLQ